MATPCDNINLNIAKGDINHDGDVGYFHNTGLPSWVAMCRVYSGDADCKPNLTVLKYVSRIEALNVVDPSDPIWAKLPNVDGNLNVAKDAYHEELAICESYAKNDEYSAIDSCATITDVFQQSAPSDWTDNTVGATCTEIGYVIGKGCKVNNVQETAATVKCMDIDHCSEMIPYQPDEKYISRDMCAMIDGCSYDKDSDICTDFDENSAATKTDLILKDFKNTALSLEELQMKCENVDNVDMVLNFEFYGYDFFNFKTKAYDNILNAPSLCIGKDASHNLKSATEDNCAVLGALHTNEVHVFDSGECVKSTVAIQCGVASFKLPIKYSNAIPYDEDAVAPLNPLFTGLNDFGEYLCKSVGCPYGARVGDDYLCKTTDCSLVGNGDGHIGEITVDVCEAHGCFFTGEVCETVCNDADCVNGACASDENSCKCDPGWSGEVCDTKEDPCEGVNCGANGTCVADDGSCKCDPEWFGEVCDTKPDVCTDDKDCLDEGNSHCCSGNCQATVCPDVCTDDKDCLDEGNSHCCSGKCQATECSSMRTMMLTCMTFVLYLIM